MGELPFLKDLFLVLVVGAGVAYLFERLRLPTLVGFLVTGVILGPRVTGFVGDPHRIELLAEIGIIALLFTIGVELSLGQLLRLWRTLVFGGGVQVICTGFLAAAVAGLAGLGPGPATFVGFVVAISSTAIVLRLLTERAETTAPHGNLALGILVFQDLVVVPMVLLVPILAGKGSGDEIWGMMLKAAAVVAITLVVARKVVPAILARVIATRSRELFLLTILAIGLGTAWATSQVGLSLGLGAFLAGLVVSESEYGDHALGMTIPFRDAFSAAFFVSVGMLVDIGYLADHLLLVLGTTVAVLVGKTAVVAFVVAVVLRYPIRVGFLSGLLLSQVGEFSFLLLHVGGKVDVVSADVRNLLMVVTGISMAFAPIVLRAAPRLSRWAASLAPSGTAAEPDEDDPPAVLVVGYGVNGRNVARALRHVGIRYAIMEMNPETVRRLRREGENITYGDATQPVALLHAGIERARVVVVTVPDPASARRTVTLARQLGPGAHIVVRTRFVTEVGALRSLGANEVVPEEFETSLEILSRVLRTLLVPRQTVEQVCREIRNDAYDMLRSWEPGPVESPNVAAAFGDIQFEVFQVAATSSLAGVAIRDSQLREDGALVLAIRRGDTTTPNPPAELAFAPNDVVLVLGTLEQLGAVGRRFRPAEDFTGSA